MRHVEVERPAVDVVLADQLGLIGLIDRGLKMLALADELAAHIDVAGMRAHREACDQTALDQQMRIVPHDLAVLAGAGLGLVGIDDEIARPAVFGFLRHEGPLHPGRESGAATAAQARRLHLVDGPVTSLVDDRLGAIPGAPSLRALQAPVMEAVKVLVDAVLVLEHQVTSFSVVGPPTGAENWRSIWGPGFGALPEAKPSSTLPKLSLVKSS